MNKTLYCLALSGIMLFTACKNDPLRINTSGIQAEVSLSRFEQELFSVDPSDIGQFIPAWQKEYGVFFRHFCFIVNLGNTDDPAFPERLKQFVTDRTNYLIYKRTMEVFPDLEGLSEDLNEAFRHYLYYFPGKNVPRVITYISGFNQSAITDEGLLAIGLDRYLGKDEELYRQAGIYSYLLDNMHPKKVLSDCMQFWGETEFPFTDSINNLVSRMVYRGRLLYFTRAMLPEQPDTLILGFTQSGLDYLHDSEKAMWAYLVENKLLFSTDRLTMDKFTLEGPFTREFGRDSPARAAVWIGMRIVQAYMTRNRDITIGELMEEKDYMKILNQSAYNP